MECSFTMLVQLTAACYQPSMLYRSSKQTLHRTPKKCAMIMDYTYTHPNDEIRYHARETRLHIDSDAAYFIIPKTRGRGARYFYSKNNPTGPDPQVKPKSSILTQCTTIKHIMTSAAESETTQVYNNNKLAIPIHSTLIDMNHDQRGPAPLKTDNKISQVFAKSIIHQKYSKSWDIKLHKIKDCIKNISIWLY